MNTTTLQDFCRTLPGATEDMKWGDNLIFSVGKKMFAGFDTDGTGGVSFKCSEDDFDRLTELPGIIPAPYAARLGWVKVIAPKALSQSDAKACLRSAHQIVLDSLPKRTREAITASGPGASR